MVSGKHPEAIWRQEDGILTEEGTQLSLSALAFPFYPTENEDVACALAKSSEDWTKLPKKVCILHRNLVTHKFQGVYVSPSYVADKGRMKLRTAWGEHSVCYPGRIVRAWSAVKDNRRSVTSEIAQLHRKWRLRHCQSQRTKAMPIISGFGAY